VAAQGEGAGEPVTESAGVDAVVPDKLYYRIGEVEALTEVPAYVLRYWESEFKLLRPKKNEAGQRLYRKRDLDLVRRIKSLLYDERLTLEGAKKRLLAESRGSAQMTIELRGAVMEETLRRLRDRLLALRERLARERK
jgi:DNA-binding transcriptional MerR regulator